VRRLDEIRQSSRLRSGAAWCPRKISGRFVKRLREKFVKWSREKFVKWLMEQEDILERAMEAHVRTRGSCRVTPDEALWVAPPP